MNTFNHVATGTVIAVTLKQPVLALPLAYASHFVLDALPHHGHPNNGGYPEALKHKKLTITSLVVELVGFAIFIPLVLGQLWYVYAAMLMAVLPDLMWPYRYLGFERFGKEPPPAGPITRFHQKIQWCERPWGIVVEILVSAVLLLYIWSLV